MPKRTPVVTTKPETIIPPAPTAPSPAPQPAPAREASVAFSSCPVCGSELLVLPCPVDGYRGAES